MRNAIPAVVAAAALLGTACQGKTNSAAPAVDQKVQAATKDVGPAAPASAATPNAAVKDAVATTVPSHAKPANVVTHAKASKAAAKSKTSKVASKSASDAEQDGEGRSPGIKLSQSPASY